MANYQEYFRRYRDFNDLVENGLNGREQRKVARNTKLIRYSKENVVLMYYATVIMRFTPLFIEVEPDRSSYYATITQSDIRRYNAFLPYSVHIYRDSGVVRHFDPRIRDMLSKKTSQARFWGSMPILDQGFRVTWDGVPLRTSPIAYPIYSDEYIENKARVRKALRKYLNWWEFMARNQAPLDESVWIGSDVYFKDKDGMPLIRNMNWIKHEIEDVPKQVRGVSTNGFHISLVRGRLGVDSMIALLEGRFWYASMYQRIDHQLRVLRDANVIRGDGSHSFNIERRDPELNSLHRMRDYIRESWMDALDKWHLRRDRDWLESSERQAMDDVIQS